MKIAKPLLETDERLKQIYDELEKEAYNVEEHTYDYKITNQIIRSNFEKLFKAQTIGQAETHSYSEAVPQAGAVADFYQYGILILDVMKLKFFSNKDDFETARDILLNNDKRLLYFKKKNGYWTQPEVYS